MRIDILLKKVAKDRTEKRCRNSHFALLVEKSTPASRTSITSDPQKCDEQK